MPTIGIAGITIPGAIDCIKKINQEAQAYFKSRHNPDIIFHQPNFGPTYEAQNQNQWDVVENRIVASITVLTKAGADFVIIPANTAHKVIKNIKHRSLIPVISMLDVVADECKNHQLKKIGILGTQWTMAEHLYQNALSKHGIEEFIPNSEDQIIVQNAIFDELILTGKTTQKTLASLLEIVEKLKENQCDGIALACTELPLVLNKENCGIYVLDTTAILAKAAVKMIVGV